MERRTFMGVAMGLAVGTGAGAAPAARKSGAGDRKVDAEAVLQAGLVERAKLAMLTMQRASWEQGVAAQALLEMGELPLVILMAREAVVRQASDGRVADLGSADNVTDPGCNGEALLRAAEATGDPALRAAADRMLDYYLKHAPRTRDGIVHHVKSSPQVWIDSAYMLPPFLAAAGHPAQAMQQIEGYRRLLWNGKKRLFAAIWDDGKKTFVNGAAWGVGNGWAAAGMARVIAALPPGMAAERARLQGWARELLDGCLAHQRDDGLFHNVLDDPSTFVETNLAQMVAYTIFRGMGEGWLPSSYAPAVERARAAARAKVDAAGLVHDVCGSPRFDSPGTATEGQAFFLLMESAAARQRPPAR